MKRESVLKKFDFIFLSSTVPIAQRSSFQLYIRPLSTGTLQIRLINRHVKLFIIQAKFWGYTYSFLAFHVQLYRFQCQLFASYCRLRTEYFLQIGPEHLFIEIFLMFRYLN